MVGGIMEKAKKFADGLMQNAQGLLCKDGYLAPVAFAAKDDGHITPVILHIKTDEDKDVIPGLLKELSQDSEYILMLMDSYVKPIAENETPPMEIKNHIDSMSAIVAFLYMKDTMFIRYMTYVKNKEGYFNFFDQGWEEVLNKNTQHLRFANPFYN
jgi:hypothetical protein